MLSESGWSYRHFQYASEKDESNSSLAGTERFKSSEILFKPCLIIHK
jgi:hypothetical protein